MTIQINTDHNIAGSERLQSYFNETISADLARFSNRITRVEVHLADENGQKGGLNDKRCTMEARVEGMQPIAVTNHGDTIEQAVSGATKKLKTSLDKIFERLSNH